MNTVITIKVMAEEHDKTVDVQDAIEQAFGEFDRIVEKYTRFAPTSELSALNRNSGEWYEVSDEFFMLIEYMLNLSKASEGVFDPTVIDLLEAYGYSAKYDFKEKLSDPNLQKHIQSIITNRPSVKEIELDKKNRKVKLAQGQRLDLGGVGKGYAIDCAYDRLNQYANFLIDAGGDIRCKGTNLEAESWGIGLKHFKDGQTGYIGKVEITNASLCSSGSWVRKIGNFHHLLNTQTGQPDNTSLTVYTYGDKAMDCDSWSTILYLLGDVKKLPKNLQGLVIKSDQQVVKSPNFPEIITNLDND